MSTGMMNPVTQPSLLYPSLAVREKIRPRLKDKICPYCWGNSHTELASIIFTSSADGGTEVFHLICGDCNKQFFRSSRLIVNDILVDQLERIYQFTKVTKKEFGALIIRNEDGIVLDQIVVGEDREVEMNPTRKLKANEEILGTIHAHPVTDEPSDFDLATFCRDCWERISMVIGVNGTINCMLKTDKTTVVDDIQSWIQQNQDLSLQEKANHNNFLLYRGTPEKLKLESDQKVPPTTLEALFKGVKGVKDFTQKVKKQIKLKV